MCGIAGIVTRASEEPVDRAALQTMLSVSQHRGPDDSDLTIGQGFGLAACRLSIVGLNNGRQPISNEDGSLVLVCNGEIYNHLELREELERKGHRFRTDSDVEVVLHAFEEEPSGFWHRLRGMFAFALWDGRGRQLLLGRDRLGIKPLHYALTPNALVFGSEQKTVLASQLFQPELDPEALNECFSFGYSRAPRTLIKQVRALLPGHWLSYSQGQVKTGCYWDLSFPHRSSYRTDWRRLQWAEALKEQLQETVHLHLRSEVEVGAWLSPGIDSSVVTSLMSKMVEGQVPTFSLGFQDRGTDELSQAKLLDEYPQFCLQGHRRQFQPKHLESLPRAIWNREQPSSLGVGVSRSLLSELAASKVKVVLTGEGADEILGGYPWYRAHKFFGPVCSLLPAVLKNYLGERLIRQGRWSGAGRILQSPPGMNLTRFLAMTGRPGPSSLLAPHLQSNQEPEELATPTDFREWHPMAQLHYFDIKTRMSNVIVPTLDLFTMAHSLEARVPFLDHHLVEFCCSIPPWIKMPGFREKAVLRQAMKGQLPASILGRRKRGLTAPTKRWLDAPRPDFVNSYLNPQRLRTTGLFQSKAVERLLAEHDLGRADHSRLLMLVLTTEIWHEQFLSGEKSLIGKKSQR